MVSSNILTKLVTKNFPMVNPVSGPTLDELWEALESYEWNSFNQVSPRIYRGSIKKVMTNKEISYTLSDANEYDFLARLWLEVI